MDVVEKDLAETRVFNLIEILKYVDCPSPFPMEAEEPRNGVHLNVVQQCERRGRVGEVNIVQ